MLLNKQVRVNLIAAMSINRVIGNGDKIPWKIIGEQFIFKMLTINKMVLMGRKTYETLDKALPYRNNIVLTRDKNYTASGCTVIHELTSFINSLNNIDELFIIGGGELYKECLPFADTIYLTVLQEEVEGDVFFPEIDLSIYKESISTTFTTNKDFKLQTYQRIGTNFYV